MFDDMNYLEQMISDREQLEPSWCTQLDMQGMQPHSRELLECRSNNARSQRKYEMIEGCMFDYLPGIQFSGKP